MALRLNSFDQDGEVPSPRSAARVLGKPAIGESFLLATDGPLGYIRIADGSVITGLVQPDGSYLRNSLMGRSEILRPLTTEDIRMRDRMVDVLGEVFTPSTRSWGARRRLHVPRVCEAPFEEVANQAEFELLSVEGGSTAISPLSRQFSYVPEFSGRIRRTALPAFRLEEAEDGYDVDFGHLWPGSEGDWELRRDEGPLPVNTATYFKIQR